MASVIDICNLALSHLGDIANVSDLDEGSAQSDHCTRFYPIARDVLLEAHAWGFATRRVVLSELSDPPASQWGFAYGLPAGYIKAISVLPEDAADDQGVPFEIEADDTNSVVFTDAENASMRYVKRITDTTKFTPLFVTALSRLLAVYLAGPIIKGSEGMAVSASMSRAFAQELAAAKASDSTGRRTVQSFTPGNISARGATVNEAWLNDGRITR